MIFNNPKQLNQAGRLMALDLGTKRIGVAISDESQLIANPKLILNRQSNEKDFVKIRQFISENKILGIVIGLPLQMDGSRQEMTEFAENFALKLDEFLEPRYH